MRLRLVQFRFISAGASNRHVFFFFPLLAKSVFEVLGYSCSAFGRFGEQSKTNKQNAF
jgi:hypothetical protein